MTSVGRYGYGRPVVSAGRRNLSHCVRNNGVVARKNFLAVSSHAMAIGIGHRDCAICHRATSFFGGLCNLVSVPTNHKQFLSSRRRLDVLLKNLSHNYAEMSSRISSKEEKCASGVVGDICRILCSTINRSLCTLY